MEDRGDERDDSNDGGDGDDGDDMFEDMSEPEESGDLTIDAPSDTDQAGVETSCADMDAYAMESPSMPLSPDANELADSELPRGETCSDSRCEGADCSPRQDAADARRSCEELEARLGEMLAEDGDAEVSKDEDSASVPVANGLKLGTPMEVLSSLTGQLGSNGNDSEVYDGDEEPETKHHDEVDSVSTAYEVVPSSSAVEQAECQDGMESSASQESSGTQASVVASDTCGPTSNKISTGDSNADSNIRKGTPEPLSTPSQPSPTVDANTESDMVATTVTGHGEGTSVQTSTAAKAEQEYPGGDEVRSASTKSQHSSHSSELTDAYSVATVFPVVREPISSPPVSTASKTRRDASAQKQEQPSLADVCTPPGSSAPNADSSKRVESRHVARLQRQLEAAERELCGAKKSFALQLSVLGSDKKTLSNRNARLHSQLVSATADLQRVCSELARVRTENELYAAKLPQLQAHLLQETTQVDESRSQSLQAQLSIGQLKARAQVIQKRNEALEAANTKLTVKLRECNQELRRKAGVIEQQASKIVQLEISIRDEKTRHDDEVMAWKHRLSSASQRAQQNLSKAESEWKLKSEKQAGDGKRRADKAVKRCRDLEACVSRLEEAAEQHKREICAHQERVASAAKEVAAMKSMLKRGNQTEATLRSELTAVKNRLRGAERDQRVSKSRLRQPSALDRTRSHPRERSTLQCVCRPQCDLPEDLDASNTRDLCSSIQRDTMMAKPAMSDAATMTTEATPACSQCPKLAQQLRDARQELTRVRTLHAQELRAQVQAMETVLKTAHQVQSA